MKSGQIIRWLAAAAGLKPAVIERGRSPAVIRAGRDNVSHALAEAIANILKPGLAALIFDAIVQECRNGEVLVPPVFQDRRGHRQQVRHVRRRGPLTDLSSMNMGRIEESAIKIDPSKPFPRSFGPLASWPTILTVTTARILARMSSRRWLNPF